MKRAHVSRYDPASLALLHGELERVLRCFGPDREHVTVIGGLVPGLLVPEPEHERHAGSADVDLCLTVALAEGRAGGYEDAATRLRDHGFRPSTVRGKEFRWRGRTGVVIDFLYPAAPGEAPMGKIRTPLEWDPPAVAALGHEFAAMAVAHGALVEATRVRVPFAPLLDGARAEDAWVHVTGPGGLAALKCDALSATGRREPKDAYDVVWLLDALGPADAGRSTVAAVADDAVARADLVAVVDQLDRLFAAGAPGSARYARFVAPVGGAPLATDERFATETVAEFTAAARASPV